MCPLSGWRKRETTAFSYISIPALAFMPAAMGGLRMNANADLRHKPQRDDQQHQETFYFLELGSSNCFANKFQ
jgi:hypothetical protein